jgi:hypothetical protein
MDKQELANLQKRIDNLPKGSTADVIKMLPAVGKFDEPMRERMIALLAIKQQLSAAKRQGKTDLQIKLENHQRYLVDAKAAGDQEDIAFYSKKVAALAKRAEAEKALVTNLDDMFEQAINTGLLDKGDILIKAISKRVANELFFQWKKELGLVDNNPKPKTELNKKEAG